MGGGNGFEGAGFGAWGAGSFASCRAKGAAMRQGTLDGLSRTGKELAVCAIERCRWHILQGKELRMVPNLEGRGPGRG